MKYYVRGRKQDDRIYEIGGPYPDREIAELEAEKARNNSWFFVDVTTAPMRPLPDGRGRRVISRTRR
jgi:hypothetical protein